MDSRATLRELYNNAADDHRAAGDENAASGYTRVDYLHVRFLSLRLARAEVNGSKRDYLASQVYKSVEAPPGDCVFQLIHDTFAKGRHCPLRLTVPEILARCGILEGA